MTRMSHGPVAPAVSSNNIVRMLLACDLSKPCEINGVQVDVRAHDAVGGMAINRNTRWPIS